MKDVREIVSQPRVVALYASLTMDDFYSIREVMYVTYDEHYRSLPEGQKREYPFEGYVRISEPVEIKLTPTNNDEIVARAVESLNEEERRAEADLNKKISGIREKKAQLLALTYQPELS
jgi:hypothetical protein